ELLELLGAAGDLRDLERRAGEGGLEDGLVTGELDLGAAAQVAAGGADLDAVGARLHHPGAGPGAPVLQLGGGDVDAHALRGSRLELDIGEALELARCAGDPRAGDGHVGLHDLAPGALA